MLQIHNLLLANPPILCFLKNPEGYQLVDYEDVKVLQELRQNFFFFLVEDFNATVLEVVVPANAGTIMYTFEVGLPQDDIVEGPEIFVIVLMVAGDPTFSISRACTVVRVQEQQFNGQCKEI